MTKEQEKLLVRIGIVLLLLQATERLINLAMLWVFQEDSPMTLSKYEVLQKANKKRTLGYFIQALRKQVAVHPDFDNLLTEFLEHRNSFVHNLDYVPGLELETPEGRLELSRFLTQISLENEKVSKIFIAFIGGWTKQVGLDKSLSEDCPEFYSSTFYADIRKTILPIFEDLVAKK